MPLIAYSTSSISHSCSLLQAKCEYSKLASKSVSSISWIIRYLFVQFTVIPEIYSKKELVEMDYERVGSGRSGIRGCLS